MAHVTGQITSTHRRPLTLTATPRAFATTCARLACIGQPAQLTCTRAAVAAFGFFCCNLAFGLRADDLWSALLFYIVRWRPVPPGLGWLRFHCYASRKAAINLFWLLPGFSPSAGVPYNVGAIMHVRDHVFKQPKDGHLPDKSHTAPSIASR